MSTLAVAALSARMLAEVAAADGFDVIALDVFGDADTRRASSAWLPIGDAASLRIDETRLLQGLESAMTEHDIAGCVVGSGLDAHAALLARIADRLPLIGNEPGVVDAVRDPRRFFDALDACGIAHPETRFEGVAGEKGWLVKDARGTGGWHIRHAGATPAESPRYLQREMAGRSMSATFIANGADAFILGFNELVVRPLGTLPCVYRGAIGPVALDAGVHREVSRAVADLARHFALEGLGSLDFILDGDRVAVLEINPRPPASTVLYVGRMTPGPMAAHVVACTTGALPAQVDRAGSLRGDEVVFARRALRIGDAGVAYLEAAGDCHDIPQAGTCVAPGDPLCSVSACAANAADVRRQLKARRDALLDTLETTT